jgi:ribosome-associated protein
VTDKPTRTRKPTAAPAADAAADAAIAPGASPEVPAIDEAVTVQDATAEPVEAVDASEAPESTAAGGAKRPGLPLREPGQVRKRPGRNANEPVGDGSIDPGEPDPTALAMAHRIVEAAEDKKASDIMLLDVRALTAVTDYFIICSGQSERQLGAIADGIAEVIKEDGTLPLGREGGANAHWVLLDFGAAIVHVMAPPEREFYQLEKLWADATLLLHVQ